MFWKLVKFSKTFSKVLKGSLKIFELFYCVQQRKRSIYKKISENIYITTLSLLMSWMNLETLWKNPLDISGDKFKVKPLYELKICLETLDLLWLQRRLAELQYHLIKIEIVIFICKMVSRVQNRLNLWEKKKGDDEN